MTDLETNASENEDFKRGTIIVAKYGLNKATGKPFESLYEFGYYVRSGAMVYNKGECNMQDSHVFKLNQLRNATEDDLETLFWGN